MPMPVSKVAGIAETAGTPASVSVPVSGKAEDSRLSPLHPDTEVLARLGDGTVSVRRIGGLYGMYFRDGKYIDVWGGDKYGWCGARANAQLSQMMLEVILHNGVAVKMGEWHRQPVKRGRKLVSVPANALREGDLVPFNKSHAIHYEGGFHLLTANADPQSEDRDWCYFPIQHIRPLAVGDCYCLEVYNVEMVFMLACGMVTGNCPSSR